jgi:hypothetical protein
MVLSRRSNLLYSIGRLLRVKNTPALVRLKPHGARESTLATTYDIFIFIILQE